MSHMKVKSAFAAAVVATGATALVIPALSSGHTTVSTFQPQTAPLTGARGTFLVRAPNEKEAQATWKIVMYVPAEIQESFSVRQDASWKIVLTREDTGKLSASGAKVMATKRVIWTARTPDAEIEPGMFGDWQVRWANPINPAKLCFGFGQYYRNLDGTRKKPEVVNWTGELGTEKPRSCLDVAAAPAK